MIKPKTTLLIIGDYPAVRADLRIRLELDDEIKIVGEGNFSNFLPQVTSYQPDIILIDMDLDRRNDLGPTARQNITGVIQQAKQQSRRSKILALSIQHCSGLPQRDFPSGIDQIFTKGKDTSRLLECIHNLEIASERNIEMAQTESLASLTFSPSRSAAVAQPAAGVRLGYIDTIRMVLIILVIMVHAAVTYGSLGDWTFVDPVQDELTSILLSLFVIDCQAFFMGLFFFLSGYFTPGSFDRKGIGHFWKDRVLRLGIPLVAYTWFLCKIPNYFDEIAHGGMQLSFGQYFVHYFFREQDEGPTWFLFALLVFSAAYTIIRLVLQKVDLSDRLSRVPAPTTKTLLLTGLVMGIFTFIISQFLSLGGAVDIFGIFSIKINWLPTYIILFSAGIVAFRSKWLEKIPGEMLRFWGWASLALILALPAMMLLGGAANGQIDSFMSGMNWRCAGLSLWLGMACVSFSTALTLWLRKQVKAGDRLTALAAPNTFAVYLFHPLVLVPITYALSFAAIHPMVKFALASVSTVIICYLVSPLLRRIPGMKSVL